MKKGDKVTMFFDCAGRISEEIVTVISVTKEVITIDDYFNTDEGEENYKFSTDSGKCLNELKSLFGCKRRLKLQR